METLSSLPHDTAEESILAWRFWRAEAQPVSVKSSDIAYRLGSISKWSRWVPRIRFEAKCFALKSSVAGSVIGFDHKVPDEACECGIYALRTKEALIKYFENKILNITHPWTVISADERGILPDRIMSCTVYGRVSLWGEIFEGENGYRAQYAYPYELIVLADDKRVAQSLREQYQVDVKIEIPKKIGQFNG